MKDKLQFLSIILFFTSILTFSQSKKIDSLHKELQSSLKNNKAPITVFKLYNQYSEELKKENQLDKSIYTYQNLIIFLENNFKGKDRDSLLVETNLNIGAAYFSNQNYNKSIEFIKKSNLLSAKNKFYFNYIKGIQNIALALIEKSRFEEAIEQLLLIPNLLNYIDDKDFIRNTNQKTFLNIGLAYLRMRNWNESIKYLNKSLQNNFSNNELKVRSYLNLSSVYLESQKSKLALQNALKADSLFQKIDYNTLVAVNIKNNIIASYDQLGDNDKVLAYIDKLIDLSIKSNSNDALFRAYGLKALAYYKSNKIDKAVSFFEKAYQVAKKSENYETLKDATQNLVEIYFLSKKYNKAYSYNQKFLKISDSINLIKQNKAVSNALIKYETLEKETQITEQNLELQTQKATIASQRNTQLLLIGGLGFLVLGGVLFYNRNKSREKQRLQAAILAEKEKGFSAVLKASEDERKRISRDLHDGIGQEMAALKMAIDHVKENETDKSQKEALSKIYKDCSKSADGIRSISHQMMPRTLLENGLVKAIDDLLISTFNFSEINTKFEHFEANERFDERIEISLYRVTQELVANIVKHSKATEVNALIYKQDNNLVLIIEDNGIGIHKNNKKGHGVLNIRSRIDMIKGTINYQPSPNSGTSATIVVPI